MNLHAFPEDDAMFTMAPCFQTVNYLAWYYAGRLEDLALLRDGVSFRHWSLSLHDRLVTIYEIELDLVEWHDALLEMYDLWFTVELAEEAIVVYSWLDFRGDL